jgi:hypothetical protein
MRKTTRKTTSRTAVGGKYKISIELPFGPFPDMKIVSTVKAKLKAKSKIVFGATTKTSRGYTFRGRMTYVKSINAPKDMIASTIRQRTPGAKVSVVKV